MIDTSQGAQPTPDNLNVAASVLADQGGMSTADTANPSPDVSSLPVNSRPAVSSPVQPIAPKHGVLSEILRAIGEVLGGPSTVQSVNPQTGAIEEKPLSRAGRIANTAGIYLRGAAAGAAQHGPAAAGKAALAGATEQQQFQQQQQENTLAQSRNVRETNAAEQEKQRNAANLALMSQQSARLGIDVKATQLEYDKNQLALINARQSILNQPGVKLLQHFDSNSEINQHLEDVGPVAAKKYAVDLANNDIQLLPSPKGGFDAVEIPKDLGEKAIGPGMRVHRVTTDPKTNQLTVTAEDADPNTTWNKYNIYEASALNAYNGNQKFQQDMKEGLQRISLQKQQIKESEATTQHINAETKLLGSSQQSDSFGVSIAKTPEGQILAPKEYNSRADKFSKDYVQPLTVLQKTTMEFNRINNNPNQTGAERVTALLNAVGISGDPLKGKGFRISNDIINEHAQARNIWEGAVAKLNTIVGSGGPITAKQVQDYTSIAQGVVHDAYVTAAQEARRQGLPVNFLPKAPTKGAVVDPLVAKIYLDAAQGDKDAAFKALQAAGYK